ncbi:defensin Cg-Defm-like isoform X2 [Crassostrea virginica]
MAHRWRDTSLFKMKVFVLLTIAVMLLVSADVASAWMCPYRERDCRQYCRIKNDGEGKCGGKSKTKCICYPSRKVFLSGR